MTPPTIKKLKIVESQNVDQPGGINLNLPLQEKIKKIFSEYGLLAAIVFVLTTYVAFVWRINDMIVARADKDAELEGRIENVNGKLDILLEDRKEANQYRIEMLKKEIKSSSDSSRQ